VAPDQVKRKLTTILSADVQGYSRLMGEDEEGTIRTLKDYFEIITGSMQQHRGGVVATGGDSILAEFGSVVDAVRCAVGIQGELKERNKELAEDRRLEFRIGINLGDVVEESDTILGDGVNIAARVQGLAEPGGICITGTVYDHIKNKLTLGYAYMGEQTVKNIKDPVRVYRVSMEPGIKVPEETTAKRAKPRPWRMAAIGLVIAVAATIIIWKFYSPSVPQSEGASKEKIEATKSEKPSVAMPSSPALSVERVLKEEATPPSPEKVAQPAPPLSPKMELADKKKMAFPLPDQPSIAVLPFVNMSGDPQQEFFSDGITEEITTALSKVRELFVISRQSSFSYKGKPVKVKQVSEELGVRYVLEGSVQRSGDRIRVNAQLIDALTGRHIWAERYDRDLKDLFALQDAITLKILLAIQVKLTEGEGLSGVEKYYKGKRGLDCYLKGIEGRSYLAGGNIKDTGAARRLAEEMMEICPESPGPYFLLSYVSWLDYWLGKSPQESLEKGIELAQKAQAMDNSFGAARMMLSSFYPLKRDYEKGIAEGERAVALEPGSSRSHLAYGVSLFFGGRSEEAIPVLQKAIRLNPLGDTVGFIYLGHTSRVMGRFEEAVSAYKKVIQREPDNFFAHTGLAATYSMMGREEEARAEAAEVLRVNPKFSLDAFAQRLTYKDQSAKEKYLAALRKAGLK
jgi:adenylate cyclase